MKPDPDKCKCHCGCRRKGAEAKASTARPSDLLCVRNAPRNMSRENRDRAGPPNHETELKSEERRAVVWLGVLAAVVGFRSWVHEDNYFNFACNSPCPHVTFAWVPVLDLLIYSWLLYAACMLVYFSEDILWEHDRARRIARRVGHGFLIIWPTTFAFVIAFSEARFSLEPGLSIFSPSTSLRQPMYSDVPYGGILIQLQDGRPEGESEIHWGSLWKIV